MTTVEYSSAASNQDANENNSGAVAINSTTALVDAVNEYFGYYFAGVTIPNGATINVAYVTIYVPTGTLDEPQHTIWFEGGSAPGVFTTVSFSISGRTPTTATVVWDNANLGAPGYFNTPSLVAIIQELMASYSYAAGAPMVMVIQGGADGTRDLESRFWDFDSSTTYSAKLHIEYTAASGGSVNLLSGKFGQKLEGKL